MAYFELGIKKLHIFCFRVGFLELVLCRRCADAAAGAVTPANTDLLNLAKTYSNSMIIRDVDYTQAHSIDMPENSYAGFVSGPVPGPVPAYSLAATIERLALLPPAQFVQIELKGFSQTS